VKLLSFFGHASNTKGKYYNKDSNISFLIFKELIIITLPFDAISPKILLPTKQNVENTMKKTFPITESVLVSLLLLVILCIFFLNNGCSYLYNTISAKNGKSGFVYFAVKYTVNYLEHIFA
jgi:uncharacterized protein YceK